MRTLMVAAMQSGTGKTVLTCALLRAMQHRGLAVTAFKCGPDYLDPMFHRLVLGTPSNNLDLFLQGEAGVRETLASSSADLAIVEGAMGLYDGIAGSDEASAWQLATQNDIPVILAVTPHGASVTLAAQIRGVCTFRSPSLVTGVVLCDCTARLAAHLGPIIERECGIAVLGHMPPMDEARFASRHLGLVPAHEVPDFQRRIDAIATTIQKTVNLDALLTLACELPCGGQAPASQATPPACRIAVARDEAFCFYYEASLARLRACGAELVDFSPLRDAELPACDALYLGGGYPELHAEQLGANRTMRHSVRDAMRDRLPTIAECGGFMLLQEELVDTQGIAHPMAGALPGQSIPTGRLVRFGYAHLVASRDNLLLRAGERVPVHEFHHWDSTCNGEDLVACKPTGTSWRCCHATPTLYAGFPHLHLAGEHPLAERFVRRAIEYERNGR